MTNNVKALDRPYSSGTVRIAGACCWLGDGVLTTAADCEEETGGVKGGGAALAGITIGDAGTAGCAGAAGAESCAASAKLDAEAGTNTREGDCICV